MARQTRGIKYAVGLSFIVAAMIVAFAVANVSAQAAYSSGMVGYWKFNGNLIDELGLHNATMGAYGSFANGIINQGLHGAMGCSNPFAAKVDNFPSSNSFTIEAWIKPDCPPNSWQHSLTVTNWKETGYYKGIGFRLFTVPSLYGGANYIFSLDMSDGTNYQFISSPLTYPCANWYHVVAIRDYGVELKLYVNGEEVARAVDHTVGSTVNTEPLFFHGFSSGGCGWGMSAITMDEAAIYNRVLSKAEIQQHYQNGLKGLGYEIMNTALVPVNFLLLKHKTPWTCEADNETEGVYRACNYFPLTYGNDWKYTTGERKIAESGTCPSTGYTGVRYDDPTNTYEFEPFLQNGKNGFMCTGCQYRNTISPVGSYLIDLQERIIFIQPEMRIGETINENHPNLGITLSTTLIGFESVTVPKGTYNALKFEIVVNDTGNPCSFKETLWLVKNIGPVKIQRTEANPANCLGCIFVCRPDNNLSLLNTPAELTSVLINE